MNITATVMAHPRRKAEAEALYKKLIQYPFSEVSITWDEKNEEWDTGSRALSAGIGKGDWHVVVQDDAILTPDFYNNIVGAVSTLPHKTLVSLYTGTVRPLPDRVKAAVAKAQNDTWLKFWLLLWGVGIVIPSDHIEPVLEYCEGREELYDMRIGQFYQINRLQVYYTNPSLVDHDEDLGSLLGHGKSPEPRRAHRVATGPVNWNNRAIDI